MSLNVERKVELSAGKIDRFNFSVQNTFYVSVSADKSKNCQLNSSGFCFIASEIIALTDS